MPVYEVQAPDGKIYDVEGPANADPNLLIKALRSHLSSAKPAPAPSTELTALKAADVPVAVLKGLAGMAQFPGQVYGLATGNFDTAAMRYPQKVQDFAESLKSEGLKAREAQQASIIAEAAKNGVISEGVAAVASTIKDPALFVSFIAEQVPQLLPALLTGGAYTALSTGARQLAKYGTKEAAEAAARAGAARVAIGTGVAQQGADVGADTYKEALDLAEKQYPGMSLEDRQALALSKARATAGEAGIVSLLAQRLPGGRAIERRMAGLPGEGRIRSALGEAASEMIEEGGGKFASNVNLQQIDPTRSLTQGVGQAAGLGAIGGGVLGGVIGQGAPAAPLQPGQRAGESLEQTTIRLQQEILNAQAAIGNLQQGTQDPSAQIANANTELAALAAGNQPLAIANQIQSVKEQDATRTVAQPSGGNLAVAVEPTAGTSANGESIERTGAIPTGQDAGVPVGGEGNAPTAVNPLLDLPDVVSTFKTERGSTYAYHSDNSTTRNRSGANHLDTTTGLQPRSAKTVFLTPDDVNKVGGVFQNADIATELVPVVEDNKPTGQLELRLTEDYGPKKAGTVLATVPYQTTPSVGLSPVEVYSEASPIGNEGTGIHFGTTITEVTPGSKTKQEAPVEAPKAVTALNEEAQTVLDKVNQAIEGSTAPNAPNRHTFNFQGQSFQVPGNQAALLRFKNTKLVKDFPNAFQTSPIQESLREKTEAPGTEAPKETRAELEQQKAENTKKIEAEIAEKKVQLSNALKTILTRMGLKDVSVKLIEEINSAEEGSYAEKLMSIAVDADNPLRVLRHETIHALKELGFFTDSQWKSLTSQANSKWIDQYLKSRQVELDGKTMSRYDAYMVKYNGNMDMIVEEAIADAFGDFSVKAPPGMLAALTARMKMLFQGIKSALNGTGFYTSDQIAEQIFTKVAKGQLKAPKATQASVQSTLQQVEGEKNGQVRSKQSAVRPDEGSREGSKARSSIRAAEPGDRGERRGEDRTIAPLQGAPSVPGANGPDPKIVDVAERYAKDKGIKLRRQTEYVKADPARGKRLADAYEAMQHNPQDPVVKEAYKNLIQQTTDQYLALKKSGYKFWFIDFNSADNLDYIASPWNAIRDLRKNQVMGVFPTTAGFGSSDLDVSTNPLLAKTDFEWPSGSLNGPMKKVLANDLFRAVHDAFGHGLEGAGFRADGEENAWQAHVKLFTGSAIGAMTSETRGQNSTVNFGPNAEFNKTASGADTIYADQKTGLMPEWTWKEAIARDGLILGTKQDDSVTFSGVHYGKSKVDTLDASKYGTGLRGAEARRLDQHWDDRVKKRVYFYIEKTDGTMPLPESGVGGYVYTQKFDNIIPPAALSKIYSKARGDANTMESLIVDAGYDGYAVPNMGMMVILNHNVPVEYQGIKSEYDANKNVKIRYSLRAPKTEAFKDWFGDSKVVDDKGEPLVVYHGTTGNIFKFNKNALGVNTKAKSAYEGFFFTNSTDNAAEYAGGNASRKGQISVKEIITSWPEEDAKAFKYAQEYRDSLKPKGARTDGWMMTDEWRARNQAASDLFETLLTKNKSGANIMPVFLSLQNPFVYDMKGQEFRDISYADLIKKAKSQKHDGVIIKNTFDPKFGDVFVAFEPTQIKSATGNIGTYSKTNPDIRYSLRDKLGMYSELENKIEAGSNKAPAASWKAYINGLTQKGVKPDEIEWSGVKDWLDLQKGTVTKDELLTYLKEGGVKVEETVLDDVATGGFRDIDGDLFNAEVEKPTKYGQYTLPGGENYREVLLTLPEKKPDSALDDYNKELFDKYGRAAGLADLTADEIEKLRQLQRGRRAVEDSNYQSSHWDQPNVLAHIRVNDRTDADGNKVLFVEELQSDFGQEGKKKGFAGTIEAVLKANQMIREEFDSMPVEDQQFAIQETKRMGLPPAAPFVTKTEGWLNLALKRIMVMAAEGGYDKVAFVRGEQATERFSLDKQVKLIRAVKHSDGKWTLWAVPIDSNISQEITPKNGAAPEALEELVGKEMADKIINETGAVVKTGASDDFKKNVRDYEGNDLKIEAKGMRAFYDTIVPTAVKKLLPKVGGGQMGTVSLSRSKDLRIVKDDDGTYAIEERMLDEFDGPYFEPIAFNLTKEQATQQLLNDARVQQPGFDVTPAMQDKVKTTGLPRFSLRSGKEVPTIGPKIDGTYLKRIQNIRDQIGNEYTSGKITFDEFQKRYDETNKEYVDALVFQKKLDESKPATSLEEVFPGFVSIPVGTKVLATWSDLHPSPTQATVVGSRDVRVGTKAYKFPVVDFNDGKKARTLTREDIKEVYAPRKFSLRSTFPQSTQASIDRITTARKDKGFISRMMEAIAPTAFSTYRQQYLNRYNQLGKYDKMLADQMSIPGLLADASSEAAALQSDLGAGLTASALGVHDRVGGIPVFRNGITVISNVNGTVGGPMQIFAKLTELGKGDPYIYQTYQQWAGSKRASRFNAQGIDTPYTAADLQEARNIEARYPEFVNIQKDYIKFNDGLVKYMLDTGIIDKEGAKKFSEHSDYIPFYRQLDGEATIGPNIFQSISGVKQPRKIKGGEAPLADFMETIVRNTQSIIQAGVKNTAAQRAVNVAMQLGPNFIKPLNYASSLPSDIVILEKGLKKYYRSSDPLWIESLKALNAADLPFNAFISGPANLLRTMVTKDPGFMLANMMRDSLAAHVTSGIKMVPIVDTIKNFTSAIAGKSPEFQALLNAGVLGGHEFSQNIEYSGKVLSKELRKKTGTTTTTEKILSPVTGLWSALEKGTTASDAATRIEVYKKTLAETGNEAEALFRALEVMNFNRKGNSPVIRVITAAIPFLNARIQGLDVLYRAGFGEINSANAEKVQKLFFIRGAQMMALSAMYWALTHDDDEYKKQESENRDNYWLLPSLGIKIPIPFEIGILFKVIPERILAYSFGDDTGQDFMKSMARQLSTTLAVNPIPQAALPVVEAVTNYSFFTQRPIVGQGMEGVAPGYQAGPGTTSVAADIGKALNISPMKLDHMIKGYSGTMGMYLMDVVDSVYSMNSDIEKPSKRLDQMPVLKRFLIDSEARGTVTAYYEMKNAADQVVRTDNLLERTFRFNDRADYLKENGKMLVAEEYVKTLEKTMKKFREMRIMVNSSSMSSDDKRDALRQITAAENKLTSNTQAMKKALQ